jgi:hypothetical protein
LGTVDAGARSANALAEDASVISFGDCESPLSFGHSAPAFSAGIFGTRDLTHRHAGVEVDVDDGKGVLEYLAKGDWVFVKAEKAVAFGLCETGLGIAGGGGVTGRDSLGSLATDD